MLSTAGFRPLHLLLDDKGGLDLSLDWRPALWFWQAFDKWAYYRSLGFNTPRPALQRRNKT